MASLPIQEVAASDQLNWHDKKDRNKNFSPVFSYC